MRNEIILVITFLLAAAACDSSPEPREVVSHHNEEAGKIALSCIDQMNECKDWKPIKMHDDRERMDIPDCDGKYDFDCKDAQDAAMSYNARLDSKPDMRSPCQQRIDACINLVRAVKIEPAKTEITNYNRGGA